MKYLKITLITLLAIFLLAAGTGLTIVFFYGDEVKNYLIGELNKRLNTEIGVKEIKFSVFEEFPMASLEFVNVSAKDAYTDKSLEKDTLFKAESVFLAFNIKDIFYKNYTVKSVAISKGKLNLKVDANGNDNYHFWKLTNDTVKTAFKFGLDKFIMSNVDVVYNNDFNSQIYDFKCNKIDLTGKFSESQFTMGAHCDLLVHMLQSNESIFLKEKPAVLDFDINVSDEFKYFAFQNSTLKVSDLELQAGGVVKVKDQMSNIDISLNAKNMNIESALSLFPAKMLSKIRDYQAEGTGFFKSHIKGDINKINTPNIDVEFGISNGKMTPEDGISTIKNINLVGVYTNGESANRESSSIEVRKFSANVNKKMLTGFFKVSDFTNPLLNFEAEGSSDLADLSAFIKLDSVENLKGSVDFKVKFMGRTREVSKENFASSKVTASGEVAIHDVGFNFKHNPLSYENLNGNFVIDNNSLSFREFTGNHSESDFKLEGSLQNLLSFVFLPDQKLNIEASFISRNLNLDELIVRDDKTHHHSDTVLAAAFFPDIVCKLNVNAGRLKYRKFESTNIKGDITIIDQVLTADKLTFSTMDGLVNISGTMDAARNDSILIACKANVKQLNVSRLFYQLGNFGQEVIQDKHLKGFVTSEIEFASIWSKAFKVNSDKIYVKAKAKIENGELIDFEPMLALSRFVKLTELRRIKFSTLQNEILIKNEKIIIPSMEIKSNALNLNVDGTHTFANIVDYRLTLLLSDILGKKAREQNTEFGVEEDDGLGKTKLFITMKGHISSPKFAYDKAAVKKKIIGDLKNEKQTLKEVLNKEFGWFGKKDSARTKKEDLNTPKDVIKIDRDEDGAEERKPVKKTSAAEQKRKDTFKKFLQHKDEEELEKDDN